MSRIEIKINELYEKLLLEQEASFYQFKLTRTVDGRNIQSCYSHWAGRSSVPPHRELREASLVKYDIMWKLLNDAGQTPLTIVDPSDFGYWVLLGGTALIEAGVAEKYLKESLLPRPIVFTSDANMISPELAGEPAQRRAPTRRTRMRVFDRDGRRCVICGQSPRNNVHIELEAHHVRPWEMSGLTEEANLVTLCSACHDGLKPHYDFTLFEHTGASIVNQTIETDDEYRASVVRYRHYSKELLRKMREGKLFPRSQAED